ncbi:MAG: CDP-diacylglycerol--serine O-phosphatidyltransferase [Desulfobacteraceae bacterium]|nr:MAG: CDP-diacylglycerol--serine O-phosphatidyltransferase [Desulfobacteraceae bacterium]
MKPRRKRKFNARPRKGIYLLPNLFTATSLFSGFFAIISSIQNQYEIAAIAILVAALFDAMDGRIARLTHTTTHFGMEFDSLADLVAFGVAPGVLAFQWGLTSFGQLGWLAAFMYVICGALRLARFNVQKQYSDPSYFRGLPIPGAAFLIATAILFMDSVAVFNEDRALVFIIMIYGLSFLMVSTIPYPSFKKVDLKKQNRFNLLVGVILVSLVIAYRPKITLFFLMILYICIGPAIALYRFKPGRLLRLELNPFSKTSHIKDRAYVHMLDLDNTREKNKSDD